MSGHGPMSGADAIAPASHGHAHGRPRHSRSRFTHVTSSLSFSSDRSSPQTHAIITESTGISGYAPYPSLHSHHASQAELNSHDGHSRALSDHRSIFREYVTKPTESALNVEQASARFILQFESWSENELVRGLLVTMPWVVLSWFFRDPAASIQTENSNVDIPLERQANYYGQKSCTVAAATLFLLACLQILAVGARSFRLNLNSTTGRAAFSRVCGVVLPVYAALKIDGFVVALTLSLVLALGMPDVSEVNAPHGGTLRELGWKWFAARVRSIFALIGVGLTTPWNRHRIPGYFALLMSILIILPPFGAISRTTYLGSISHRGISYSQKEQQRLPDSNHTGFVEDANVNILGAAVLSVSTAVISSSRGTFTFHILDSIALLLVSLCLAISFHWVSHQGLRSPQKFGLLLGSAAAAVLCNIPAHTDFLITYATRSGLTLLSYFISRIKGKHPLSDVPLNQNDHHYLHSASEPSKATKLILQYSESYPLLYSILKERDSRSIFYFMSLNFSFMLVQLTYGFLTGSLGLLSDSIHMFFDCLALAVGLCAAVMSKWPPSTRFPYGYGKVDTLSGFANGIFLMIISIEIIYEAVERLSSGSQMHRIGELLVVSVAGLCINLVGIVAFEHGHGHGHDHDHGHSYGHSHSHTNENMHGIFLHILADTLGSVAVVISTILVHFYGWSGFDPIASCLIAILIFVSAVPLVTSTAKKLLLALPADVEYTLRDTLAGVSTLNGVATYTVPKFWLDDTGISSAHDDNHHHHHHHHHTHSHEPGHSHDGDLHHHANGHCHEHDHQPDSGQAKIHGVIHVIASRGADLEDVRQRAVSFLQEKNMDILVQIEREGDGRCWCGGGNRSPGA